jgi:aminoglycoside phosphotransferase (APT) family kinase protein
LAYCDDPSVFGAAFYIMERVQGRVFSDASLPGCDAEWRATAYAAMADVLARLHRQDWREPGLGDFGRPESYFARQVKRWGDRWRASGFRTLPELEGLAGWLEANLPPEGAAAAVVHGDYRIGNLILGPDGAVSAVLDWELSTIGHPLADLAHSCLWWRVTPEEYGGLRGLDLKALGIPEERQYVDRYYASAALGEPLLPFHLAFAFFRLAVIFEGIALRARQGNAASADAARVGDLSVCFARRGLEATHHRDNS